MKTYLFNFEYDYIAANADSLEKALELATVCIVRETDEDIEEIENFYKVSHPYNAGTYNEVKEHEIKKLLRKKEENINELYSVIPVIVEPGTAMFIEHGNE